MKTRKTNVLMIVVIGKYNQIGEGGGESVDIAELDRIDNLVFIQNTRITRMNITQDMDIKRNLHFLVAF